MFLNNKYTKWYYSIIDNAKKRVLSNVYVESHHIIPRSLSGSNDKTNLVDLLAREHYICHLLLVRMTEGKAKHKMLSAMWFITNLKKNNFITSRMYSNIKEEYVRILKETPQSKESNSKRSATMKTKSIVSPNKGKFGKLNPFFGKKHKHPKRFGIINKGREPWNKNKQGLQVAWNKGLTYKVGPIGPQKQLTCPHCNKQGGISNMKRYHYDKCRLTKQIKKVK